MSLTIATHSGPFHADDVLAVALIRRFVDEHATVVRTRDPARLQAADLVVDVGGTFDPAAGRFDHHQNSYQGPLSSAGMVLEWLEAEDRVPDDLAAHLRDRLVDYVDDVDNGRRQPDRAVPCFAGLVEAMREGHEGAQAFDAAFEQAVGVAGGYVAGLQRAWRATVEARQVVRAVEMPPFTKVSNRVGVIFRGEDPVLA